MSDFIERGVEVVVDTREGPKTVSENTVWNNHRVATVVSINEEDNTVIVTIPDVAKSVLFRYPRHAVKKEFPPDEQPE